MSTASRRAFACLACEQISLVAWEQCRSCGAWGTCADARSAARSAPAVERLRCSLGSFEARAVERYAVAEPWHTALGGGLAVGSSVLVSGRAGTGKTTEAIRLAASVAGALYLPAEPNQSPADLRAIALRLGLEVDHVEVAQPSSLDDVLAILREPPDPPLVIVDSLSVLGDPVAAWQQIRGATRAAFVSIVHVNKTGRMGGRETLKHLADTVIQITRRSLIVGKNRHASAGGRVSVARDR